MPYKQYSFTVRRVLRTLYLCNIGFTNKRPPVVIVSLIPSSRRQVPSSFNKTPSFHILLHLHHLHYSMFGFRHGVHPYIVFNFIETRLFFWSIHSLSLFSIKYFTNVLSSQSGHEKISNRNYQSIRNFIACCKGHLPLLFCSSFCLNEEVKVTVSFLQLFWIPSW